jgi:hypothetical protein
MGKILFVEVLLLFLRSLERLRLASYISAVGSQQRAPNRQRKIVIMLTFSALTAHICVF